MAVEPPVSHTQSSATRAVAALGGGEIAARSVAFLTAALLARRLGPEGFGVLGFATAVCSYFALAVTGGLSDIGAREVAHHRTEARRIYTGVLAVRLVLGGAALAALVLVAWWLPRPATGRIVLALSGLSFLSVAIDPSWVYRALERSGLAATALIAAQVLFLAGAAAFVSGPGDVIAVPVVQFAAELVVALALAVPLLGFLAPVWRWRAGAVLFREAAPILFGRGMRTIIVSFDMVLLAFLTSDRDLGIYAAAYRLCFLVLALAVAVNTAYLPAFARAAARGTAELQRVSDEALGTAALIGAPLVAGGIVTAGPLLAFLFGPPYAAGALALQWLLVSLFFVFVHAVLHDIYLATNRTHVEAGWFAAAALINVAANLWWIPRFGIAGAGAATALAEAVIAAGGIFRSRLAKPGAVGAAWLRPVAAAAVMAAVVWVARHFVSLPAQLAIGGLVYIGVVIGLLGPRTAAARIRVQIP